MARPSKKALDRLEEALPRDRTAGSSDPVAPGASVVALDGDSDEWLGQFALESGHSSSAPEAPAPVETLDDFESEIETAFSPEPAPAPASQAALVRSDDAAAAGDIFRRVVTGSGLRSSSHVATAGMVAGLLLAGLLGTTALLVFQRGRTSAASSGAVTVAVPGAVPRTVTAAVPEHVREAPSIQQPGSTGAPNGRVSAAASARPEPLRASPEADERRLPTPQPPAFVLTSGRGPAPAPDERTPPTPTPASATASSLPVAVATASVPAADITAIGVPAPAEPRPSAPVPIPASTPAAANAVDRIRPEPADRPVTRAPAERPVPPVPAGETAAIQAILGRYQTAFNDLNASIAKSVWPSLDEQRLGKAFDQLERQDLAFDACRIDVADAAALASCEGHTRYVRKVGNRTERIEPRVWTFRLQNTTEGWIIAGVDTR